MGNAQGSDEKGNENEKGEEGEVEESGMWDFVKFDQEFGCCVRGAKPGEGKKVLSSPWEAAGGSSTGRSRSVVPPGSAQSPRRRGVVGIVGGGENRGQEQTEADELATALNEQSVREQWLLDEIPQVDARVFARKQEFSYRSLSPEKQAKDDTVLILKAKMKAYTAELKQLEEGRKKIMGRFEELTSTHNAAHHSHGNAAHGPVHGVHLHHAQHPNTSLSKGQTTTKNSSNTHIYAPMVQHHQGW